MAINLNGNAESTYSSDISAVDGTFSGNVDIGGGDIQLNADGTASFGGDINIDSSGRLLVGTSTSPSTGSGNLSRIVVQGNLSSASGSGYLSLQRGQAAASVASGAGLGLINFGDNTGSSWARITAEADGTPGTDDYPGRLSFSTTADGASSPTTRVRIASDGNVSFWNSAYLHPITDNVTGLGLSGFRWTSVWAANGTIQTSDERAKSEITDATLGADFIKALRPVSYKWIEGGKRDTGERDEDGNYIYESFPGARTHWGFIAQEVKQVVDAAGVDFGGWVLTDKDDPDSQQALRYDQFIAPLTKALQEAMTRIEALEAKVQQLEGGTN